MSYKLPCTFTGSFLQGSLTLLTKRACRLFWRHAHCLETCPLSRLPLIYMHMDIYTYARTYICMHIYARILIYARRHEKRRMVAPRMQRSKHGNHIFISAPLVCAQLLVHVLHSWYCYLHNSDRYRYPIDIDTADLYHIHIYITYRERHDTF